MAWVERLVTRTTQPQDAVGIDLSNPIAKKFKLLIAPATHGVLDLVGGLPITKMDGGTFIESATQIGKSTRISGQPTAGTYNISGGYKAPNTIPLNGQFTFFAYVNPSKLQSANSDYITGLVNAYQTAAGAAPTMRFGSGANSGTRSRLFGYAKIGGADRSITDSVDAVLGQALVAVLTYNGSTLSLYKNGALVGSVAASGSVDVGAYTALSFLNDYLAANLSNDGFRPRGFEGDFYLAGVAPQSVSSSEIKSLSDNPWAIFEPEVTRLWIDDTVSTGGAATVIPIGVQATGSVGTPSATGAARATPAGVSASSAVGTPIAVGGASIPATALPAGVQATAAIGTVSARGAAVAQPAGVTVTGAVGTPSAIAGTSIPATVLPAGVQASSAVGTPTVTAAAIAQPLGVAAIAYVGTPTIATGVSGVAVAYPAGVQAIGQVGTLIATGAAWTAAVGVQAVASVGAPFAYEGALVSTTAGAQTRPSRLQDSVRFERMNGSRPGRMQTGSRASR